MTDPNVNQIALGKPSTTGLLEARGGEYLGNCNTVNPDVASARLDFDN
jgi:hypothetical protein